MLSRTIAEQALAAALRTGGDFAEIFWLYCRKTPFYEIVLARLSRSINYSMRPVKKTFYRTVEDSLLRPVAGIFFPLGSERRERLKKLLKRKRS